MTPFHHLTTALVPCALLAPGPATHGGTVTAAQAFPAFADPCLDSHLPHLILVVVFLATGFWHLQLALVRRSVKEYFWIGVVALLMGLRQIGLGGWLEDGAIPPGLLHRLEWANFFLACLAFVAFMRVLSRESPRRWLLWVQRSFLAPVVLVLALPDPWQVWFVRYVGMLWPLPMLVGFVALLVQAHRERQPDTWLLFGGSLLLLGGSLHEIGAFLDFWPRVNALGWAFALFLGNMALLVHVRFTRALEEAQRLSRALAEEIQSRRRLSRELHDGIGGELTSALLLLQGLQRRGEVPATRLARVGEIMQGCMDELRSLVWILKEDASPLQELAIQIHDRLEKRLADHGIALDFEASRADPSTPLSSQLRFQVLRMVQELATNTLKHAGAARVSVVLSSGDGRLALTYRDDGKGLPEGAAPRAGHGLDNLQHRARFLKGDIVFDPPPGGSGFQACLSVPL